jgi:hypothetical protein
VRGVACSVQSTPPPGSLPRGGVPSSRSTVPSSPPPNRVTRMGARPSPKPKTSTSTAATSSTPSPAATAAARAVRQLKGRHQGDRRHPNRGPGDPTASRHREQDRGLKRPHIPRPARLELSAFGANLP